MTEHSSKYIIRPLIHSAATHKVEDMTVAGNRTLIGKYTTKDGKISLTGLKPGVYYVVETKPREGYELAEDRDQIIALTGGMDVTVTDVDEDLRWGRRRADHLCE